MGIPATRPSIDEFIAWENQQPGKHEFVRGEVYAMVGARRIHGRVVANLVRALGNRLLDSGCQVFTDGMKLQVADDAIFYPDVFVTCHPDDLRTDQIFRSPLVVVEVLSPSTESYDVGLKFAWYRRIAALREHVVIDPMSRLVEVFRLGGDGLWVLHDQTAGDELRLTAIDARIPLAEVFAGVDAA